MRTPKLALAAVLAAAFAASAAHADTAESLKREGMAAAQKKDWELARQKFEASYALDPRPLTLYNLATAQEKADQLVAARATFRTFLEKSPRGGDAEQFRAIAKTKLAALEKAIPTLTIQISGFTAGTSVELDGRAVAAPELAAPIAVDPGDHVVVVLRGGASIVRRTVGIARGDGAEVELTAPPPPVTDTAAPAAVAPPPPPLPSPKPRRGGVLSSGWFWGVAAAVVVGAAAGGYYLRSGGDPTRGTLGPGTLEVP